MNIIVIGAGGIGAFYGMILHKVACNITFVARGENLKYLKNNEMELIHTDFKIKDKVETLSIDELCALNPKKFDAILLTTKSMSTKSVSKKLGEWTKNIENPPFYISLQNGVENEDIMCEFYKKEYVIGGLTRLIGAQILSLGKVEATGEVQTLLGAIYPNKNNSNFLEKFNTYLQKTPTTTFICENIKLELWNKLIINNGVNAICALLEEKTRVLLDDEKVSKIIYGLMCETAKASNAVGVNLTQENAKKMFEIIKNFESIKPSMLIDRENNRNLELEDICEVVIRNCEKIGVDAPYTRSVSTILEFLYNKKRVL